MEKPETKAPSHPAATRAAVVVIVVFGLPGAGKSHLVKQIVSSSRGCRVDSAACCSQCSVLELDDLLLSAARLSDTALLVAREEDQFENDERRTTGEGLFDLEAWRSARGALMERCHHAIHEALHPSTRQQESEDATIRMILVVDNFPLKSSRVQLLPIVRAFGGQVGLGTVHVETSLSTCLARNAKRSGRGVVPDSVIERMAARMECGATRRHDKSIPHLVVDGDSDNAEDAVAKIWSFAGEEAALFRPSTVAPTALDAAKAEGGPNGDDHEASVEALLPAARQQFDLALRREVAAIMQTTASASSPSSTGCTSLARRLAHTKRELLAVASRLDSVMALDSFLAEAQHRLRSMTIP